MTASFELTTEQWIPVVDLNGAASEVSLRTVLLDAHRIRRIVGETPPMTAALYRVVLALLHRIYGPEDGEAWHELWSSERFDEQLLDAYFVREAEKFDLFHPVRPFFQCAELASVKKSSIAKLIPHKAVGNNVTLFDHLTAQDHFELSPSAAARWLVTTQAFDPGGMKTPYQREKSSERAPCNTLGVVLIEGGTLRETLLLNALMYSPKKEKPPGTKGKDSPVWEQDLPIPLPDGRHPKGWTDLLTWPSRRVLLFPELVNQRTVVTQAVMTPGVRLKGELSDQEWMTAYRRPKAANGKFKMDLALYPVRLHPVRGIWRHSVELLLVDQWNEEKTRQRPRVLKQIADLIEHQKVAEDTVYTLRIFGQKLDSKSTVVEAYLEEEMLAPLALVRAEDEGLASLFGCAIELADEAGVALRSMQREYYKDMRVISTAELDVSYWPTLTKPFNVFLQSINTARLFSQSETGAIRTWKRQVILSAEQAADRWQTNEMASGRNFSMAGKASVAFRKSLKQHEAIFDGKVSAYIKRDGDK